MEPPPRNVAEWVRRLYGGNRPGAARTVASARIWLESHPQPDRDEKPVVIRWTDQEANRLLFARWLIERGRLTE